MMLENIFPPLPSEIIMPFAGFVAARGELSMVGVIIAGTVGTVLGTFFWYYVARLFGEKRLRAIVQRFGRPLTMTQNDLDVSKSWFKKYGKSAIFFGRLLPAIRTLISIPAGIVRMPLVPFFLLTTLGSLLWISFLTFLGVVLDEQYEIVEDFINPVSNIVLILLVSVYVYRFITFKPSVEKNESKKVDEVGESKKEHSEESKK